MLCEVELGLLRWAELVFFSERSPSGSEGWLSEEIKKPRGRGLGQRNTNKSI